MKRITSFLHTGKYSTIILVQGKKGKRKWIERNQHRPRKAEITVNDRPVEKRYQSQFSRRGYTVLFLPVLLYVSPLTALVYTPLLSDPPFDLAPSPHYRRWWVVVFGDSGRPFIARQSETE